MTNNSIDEIFPDDMREIIRVGDAPIGSIVQIVYIGGGGLPTFYRVGRLLGDAKIHRHAWSRFTGHRIDLHCSNRCKVLSENDLKELEGF